MAFTSRETIFVALFNLLKTAVPPAEVGGVWNLQSRDLRSWDEVSAANQPALFMVELPEHASEQTFTLEQWKLPATAWTYYKTDGIQDSTVARDTIVNKFVDAFNGVIRPHPGERQTLGGLVRSEEHTSELQSPC